MHWLALWVAGALRSTHGASTHDDSVVTVVSVSGQQVASFHLDQIDQLGVIHQVDLVDEDDQLGHPDLPASRICSRV